jgi:predicted RNase H-like HicB family nuclease
MELPVTLYVDEDGWYVVDCPVIPGCASQGRTEAEALANIREAIELCLEVRREKGLPLLIESRTVEVAAVA